VNGWISIASGVYLRRYGADDLTVVVIEGPDGLVVVDSRGSTAQAEELLADVRALSSRPAVALINTHAHYDHTFGNYAFSREPGMSIVGHGSIHEHFSRYEEPRLLAWRADPNREPDKRWNDVVLTPPTMPISEGVSTSLAGRAMELIPLDPGHTDTDLAIHIPDARVWIVGDVVEQSGPPMYGSGCYPLDWAQSVRRLAGRIDSDNVVVPGHGTTVDLQFMLRQASELASVADAVNRSFEQGLTIDTAVPSSKLPWPDFQIRSAFVRGYAQLSDRS
jgi:glyoxylase-like metal-dependent hydrolase (beta-lactamase superfamily II)